MKDSPSQKEAQEVREDLTQLKERLLLAGCLDGKVVVRINCIGAYLQSIQGDLVELVDYEMFANVHDEYKAMDIKVDLMNGAHQHDCISLIPAREFFDLLMFKMNQKIALCEYVIAKKIEDIII